MANKITVGLWVILEAKKGKEKALMEFLQAALPLVNQEVGTINWYAIKLTPTTFAIFDTFANDSDRTIHLTGRIAETLMAKAEELLASPPKIEKVDILAAK